MANKALKKDWEKLQKELKSNNSVKGTFRNCITSNFSELSFDADTLYLSFRCKAKQFAIMVSDTYPKGESMLIIDGGDSFNMKPNLNLEQMVTFILASIVKNNCFVILFFFQNMVAQ